MKRESQFMSKKDREQFCCVYLQKPGHVCTCLQELHLKFIIQTVCRFQRCKQEISPSFCSLSEEVTYRWIYNEFPVFLNTDRRRFVSQKTGNLYIAKVEAQDAGNYSCFVSSPVLGKSVFSKFIPLIPLPPEDG